MNESRCVCRNHMGTSKARHKSREAALIQAVRWHIKRARGMKFTIVECPTDENTFHIISGRKKP